MGVPAARGHGGDGGADIRGGLRGPEHIVSVPVSDGDVDRPLGSFGASTKGLERCFARFSLGGQYASQLGTEAAEHSGCALRTIRAVIEWGGCRW